MGRAVLDAVAHADTVTGARLAHRAAMNVMSAKARIDN
jgi:hypothetical protein